MIAIRFIGQFQIPKMSIACIYDNFSNFFFV